MERAARALGGRVDLLDALDMVVLLGETGDRRFPAWAERWIERVTAEHQLQPPAVASMRALMREVPTQGEPRAVTLALQSYARPPRNWG